MSVVYELNEELLHDCINIVNGLFAPLEGFMSASDYHSVVNHLTLQNGAVWTIPIGLDVDRDTYMRVVDAKILMLTHHNKAIARLEIDDCYVVDLEEDIYKIFGTSDRKHPGVQKELLRSKYRVGGKVYVLDETILENSLKPNDTKAYFQSQGWRTIAGFQTRNPIHKAHEHLQRVALEVCDALFINPLVGWKKTGDFSEDAVVNGYQTMIQEYYTGLNIYFQTLKTPMRYAGPKEAVFHALIRRNLGCTHFIIGRDHAGVGDYYGKYEAQTLAKEMVEKHDLGIEILLLSEPFYCRKCAQIVSEKTCGHDELYREKISGTKIRALLANDERPSELFMRKEVADSIIRLKDKKFIKGE